MANVKKNNVNFVYDKKNNRVVTRRKSSNNKNRPKKTIILDDEIDIKDLKKAKNKQKYYARQRKYQQNNNPKKIIENPELKTTTLIKTNSDEESIPKRKKVIENPDFEKTSAILKKKDKEENNQKEISFDKEIHEKKKFNFFKKDNNRELPKVKKQIINFDENSDLKKIPLGNAKVDNRKRVKIYLKEAIVYAIFITIINVIAIFVFDYVNYLKLFDIKGINIAFTVVLSLIVSYAFSFFIDCLVSEVWIKIKSKHREGEQNGNSWIKRRKNKENITN